MLGVTSYMARQVNHLRKTKGPFSFPDLRPSGHPITDELKLKIKHFYMSEDNSRVSSEAHHAVKVANEEGIKSTEARRYMMLSVRDAYLEFKIENPNEKIGITKFFEEKPKQCKWPGSRGLLISCTCIIHENFQLLIDGLKSAAYDSLSGSKDPMAAALYAILDNTDELIKYLQCPDATEICNTGFCSQCPSEIQYDKLFENIPEDDIEFSEWTTTPSTVLNEVSLPVAKFKEKLFAAVQKFIVHRHIYLQQKAFIKNLRDTLPGTPHIAVVNVDYGENYTFVIQHAVQGFHWTNYQATIHPFVVYYAQPDGVSTIQKTYFIISNEPVHDATSFHAFRCKVIEKLRRDLPHITHLEYFSDGAGSQYKNYKNIANLFYHYEDFGLHAKWHYTATSHGKLNCDAMSAVVKRTIRLRSTRDNEKILSAEKMYSVAKRVLSSGTLEFVFVDKNEVFTMRNHLSERYESCMKIPGIRSYHYFDATATTKILAKVYSASDSYETYRVLKDSVTISATQTEEEYDVITLGEFYGIYISKSFQVGKVILLDSGSDEVTMSMMKKSGKDGRVLKWPPNPMEYVVSQIDMLAPITAPELCKGSYRLSEADRSVLLVALQNRLQKVCLHSRI